MERVMDSVMRNLVSIVFSLLIVILILASLFDTFGWIVVYAPVLLVVVTVAVAWTLRIVLGAKARRALKLATQKRRIAELEDELGIRVLTDGACPHCGASLLLGAAYCSACGQTTHARIPPRICDQCQTRNLDNARYCGVCGAALPAQTRAAVSGGALKLNAQIPATPSQPFS